jgi:hypothetical protein
MTPTRTSEKTLSFGGLRLISLVEPWPLSEQTQPAIHPCQWWWLLAGVWWNEQKSWGQGCIGEPGSMQVRRASPQPPGFSPTLSSIPLGHKTTLSLLLFFTLCFALYFPCLGYQSGISPGFHGSNYCAAERHAKGKEYGAYLCM